MNIELLKASFEMVAPDKEAFIQRFYQRLFSSFPQIRLLFAQTDMQRQERAHMAVLAVVVAGLEQPEKLLPLMSSVLLETFEITLGPKFTSQMRETWSQALEMISKQMIHASEQPAGLSEVCLPAT